MFAHTRAASVAVASTRALPVSVRRNSRSAVRLCQTVRPENSDPDDADSPRALSRRRLAHRGSSPPSGGY